MGCGVSPSAAGSALSRTTSTVFCVVLAMPMPLNAETSIRWSYFRTPKCRCATISEIKACSRGASTAPAHEFGNYFRLRGDLRLADSHGREQHGFTYDVFLVSSGQQVN